MNKTLSFSIEINAPRSLVWDFMLSDEGYRQWTVAFCEGSHFVGSWAKGSKMLFLAPNGSGMTSLVAENHRLEFVSVRHIGEVVAGVEDTSSAQVLAWAPAHENFSFFDVGVATRVKVDLDTAPESEQFMNETYPKALELLKTQCEQRAGSAA